MVWPEVSGHSHRHLFDRPRHRTVLRAVVMYRQVVKLTTCFLLISNIKGEDSQNDKAINDTAKPKRQVLTGNPLDFFVYPSTNEGNNYFKPIQVAEPSQINQLTASTDSIIYQHSDGQLQDSYGNRFQDSPYASQLQQKITQQPASAEVHQQFSFQADQPQQGIFLQNMQLPFSQTFQKQLQAQNYQASNTFSVPHRDLGTIPVDFGSITQDKNKAVYSQPLTDNIRAPQGPPSSYQQLQQQHFTNNPNGFHTPQFGHSAVPARLQAVPQFKQQPVQQIQKPLSQIKTINPQFLKPQVFANPIVPQHQHFIPPIRYFLPKVHQIPADAAPATTVAPPPPPPPPPPPAPTQRYPSQVDDKPRTASEGGKRGGMKHQVREEVKGVIIREEEGGEDDFEEGYKESARGFPSYKRGQKDESDDDRSEQDEDEDESREQHQSNSYARDQEDDDDDSNSYSPEYNDGQSRRNNYYSERGHTRHSDDEREPRKSSYRSSYKVKSKPKSYYSQKYSSDDSSKPKYASYRQYSDDEDRPKYYNSRPDSHYRKGNNRYEKYRSYSDAEDSYHDNSAPHVTKSKFVAPKSEYGGFEPIPHSSDSSPADSRTKLTSAVPSSGEAKAAASRPGTKRKLYKENWFISKTKTA